MSDPVLVALITGVFLLLTAAVNVRVSRNSERYKGLEVAVGELAKQNADQAGEIVDMQKEVAGLHSQLAVFQAAIDRVYAILDSAPDSTTIGELRPSLPTKPTVEHRVWRGKMRPAHEKEGD
jgi:hypothetical protein